MEVAAIVEMFQRSLETLGVKYRNYIGDGDSKTYSGVIDANPYGEDFLINKKECVGHVQKRMGTRLRDLVNKTVVVTTTKTGKTIKKNPVWKRTINRQNDRQINCLLRIGHSTQFRFSSEDEK